MKSSGILITFEGTEGSGKSTLLREVARQLASDSERDWVLTREPGGSSVAEKIRALILQESMDPWTEIFLYEAARAEHLARTIRPALSEGKGVLCDRFTDSSLAYQAHARGLPWKEVKALNRTATQKLEPHLTVWLDIDPEVGLKRAREFTRFEAEGVEFQHRVRLGYARSRKESPKRWLRLDVSRGTPEELGARVVREIRKRFSKKRVIPRKIKRGAK